MSEIVPNPSSVRGKHESKKNYLTEFNLVEQYFLRSELDRTIPAAQGIPTRNAAPNSKRVHELKIGRQERVPSAMKLIFAVPAFSTSELEIEEEP